MKTNLIFSTILLSGLLITGCSTTAEQKVENAKDASQEATDNYIEEMENYKAEKLAIIEANDEAIAKIKENNDKSLTDEYKAWVLSLEQKNEALRDKLNEYEDEGESNWKLFKTEFNHDMDELGLAFKNIFKDSNS